MKLNGGNLDEVEVQFDRLSKHQLVDNPELLPIIQYLENYFYEIVKQANSSTIHELPCEGDKVCIKPGMVNHKCSNSLEILKTISEYGVLATEWFGILESELEGRFCAFVDRIKPDGFRDPHNNTRRLRSIGNDVVLFFDADNEVMQKLLHLDYFEYVKVKKENPEKIGELYSVEEIALLDKLIEPLSPASKNFHDDNKNYMPYYYWSAIPGGIPSILINGICLKNNQYSDDYVKALIQLFPNATIFNGDLQIIYRPTKEISDQKKL